ncbi:UPF0043 inner membrane protein YdjZ [Candidatus Syntrophocurvum alkaliphilum]|uniref:TVP38/TMEM64 family membrane protein n=1 Tax=Candidatus Syntrophocurvum alkaliphilum TaxID=2293317 RepID=A0A6I6DIB9_9FIRM|nr:VTT domain-containing protein [Candidatus Syntrophocurvum alkaliphilum]QGU00634.1 UPF0043 inner membrane protein YdjZ [Candidatus Syntrophocurvum alkaliphilum]
MGVDINILTEYINSFGFYAPAIAFILFTCQAIFPVFPFIILAATGGILFGAKVGFLLAWLGALLGASIAFWCCRMWGTTKYIKLLESRYGYNFQTTDASIAFLTVILIRVFPVVPTPLINIGAALGGMSFKSFFFSSAIGKIPTAFLYTTLGLSLFNTQDLRYAFTIIGAILVLLVVGKYIVKKNTLRSLTK